VRDDDDEEAEEEEEQQHQVNLRGKRNIMIP
jgi:hypothetical protein